MPVREISNDSLHGELTAAGDKLVMVDFFATWFEISNIIAIVFNKSSYFQVRSM
jgi:hypothetical protein